MNDEFQNLNVEAVYRALFRIIEEREGVKIKFTVERRKKDGIPMQVQQS